MQLSWGAKIAMMYTGFVALILTLVIFTFREKIDLVTPDYYEQELHYQEKIDRINRTAQLQESLTWQINGNNLSLAFPKELTGKKVSAELLFFCPANAANDFSTRIAAGNELQRTVSLAHLKPGAYNVQINWQADREQFYTEGTLRITR